MSANLCQGFSHFSVVFLHHFVLAKLATSRIRVNCSREYVNSMILSRCRAFQVTNVQSDQRPVAQGLDDAVSPYITFKSLTVSHLITWPECHTV